jgi:hypothetical protein
MERVLPCVIDYRPRRQFVPFHARVLASFRAWWPVLNLAVPLIRNGGERLIQ